MTLADNGHSRRRGVRTYLIGLGLAILMTIASFWAAQTHLIYGPGISVAIVVLAIAQMGIHLVFFLHITTAPTTPTTCSRWRSASSSPAW